jgi:amidohydrolase
MAKILSVYRRAALQITKRKEIGMSTPGKKLIFILGLAILTTTILYSDLFSQEAKINPLWAEIDQLSAEVESKCISWRRDIHQNPELGNREFRTSKLVAEHLKSLGLEVKTGIAHTGVVGILRGKKDTPVVALRADMDALPVTEAVEVPFASKVKAQYEGREVGVMHACGHDAHTAVLMAVAEVLSKIKDQLPGTVKFIFQPAEEGAPKGEEGGAYLMVKEGVLASPKVDAIFGLHVNSVPAPVGMIFYRSGGLMASGDRLAIVIKGSQTHGAMPWAGVDPVVVASQIVMGLQTIVSRQTNLTATPAVVTIANIHGGNRFNIIPEKVEMEGTIRVFDSKIQDDIHDRIRKTARSIAESSGAIAEVTIEKLYPVTFNDPNLTQQMVPTLERVAGKGKVLIARQATASEDFAFFQEKVPGLFFFLNVKPEVGKPIPNHSPNFYMDENALIVGIRAMSNLAIDFLASK